VPRRNRIGALNHLRGALIKRPENALSETRPGEAAVEPASLAYLTNLADPPVLEIQRPGVSERRMPNTKGSRQTRNAR